MQTRVLLAAEGGAGADAVREAAEALARGDLIVFPTETVYGVGASACDARALDALHALKDRPSDKPFALHLGDPEEAARYAGDLPLVARRLIRKGWPGPFTLVVPDRRPPGTVLEGLIERGVYHEGTVGLRCPDHAVGRAILRGAGVPVVASSANLAGRPPPRRAGEALAELDGRVPLVVDSGPTRFAHASTVVRVSADNTFQVLREGAVPARRIERMARTRVLFICTGNMCRSPMAVGLARRLMAERIGCDPDLLDAHGIEITSAGTGAGAGRGPSLHAVQAMAERGIDIRDHRSQPMTVDALLAADYIYVMTRGHMDAVRRLAPEVADRGRLVDGGGRDVPDPIGGDLDIYRACAEQIAQGIASHLQELV